MAYSHDLHKFFAEPVGWKNPDPGEEYFLKTQDGIYLKILKIKKIVDTYFACFTCRGTYFIKYAPVKYSGESDDSVGLIKVKPEKGKKPFPMEYFDREGELNLFDDPFGFLNYDNDKSKYQIEEVEQLWKDFYRIRFRGKNFYVICIE